MSLLAVFALLVASASFCNTLLSCEKAVSGVQRYNHTVKGCRMIGGMPIIEYDVIRPMGGGGSVPVSAGLSCDVIPGIFAPFGRPVTDCLQVNGSAFFRIDKRYDWEASVWACQAVRGGNLASIRGIHEFKLVRDLVDSEPLPGYDVGPHAWIGLNDIDQEGVYRWSDDGSISTYNKFVYGEPDGGTGSNCMIAQTYNDHNPSSWHYIGNVGYSDQPCTSTAYPICKVSLG